MNTINGTNFEFPGQKSIYKGKVREVYNINNDLLVMIATDRLSAFDVILPRQIPFKGQILNQIATKMMNDTSDIVPNWLIANPDENVAVGHLCDPFKVEMVIRGYLSGHAAREYKAGKRTLCGVVMVENLKENIFEESIKNYIKLIVDKFPYHHQHSSMLKYQCKFHQLQLKHLHYL